MKGKKEKGEGNGYGDSAALILRGFLLLPVSESCAFCTCPVLMVHCLFPSWAKLSVSLATCLPLRDCRLNALWSCGILRAIS